VRQKSRIAKAGAVEMAKVAILVENYYEEMELWYPYYRLKEAGYSVELVGTEKGKEYKGKHGYPATSDKASSQANAKDYDAIVIPGGYAPDWMRRCEATLQLVKDMDKVKKPIAAICHAGWMLASCCNLEGKKVTSFSGIRDDLVHAGAKWSDAEVMVDGHLITSRKPADLPAFMKELLKLLKA
jgi:protease I